MEHLDNMTIFGGMEPYEALYVERIFGDIIERYGLDELNDNLNLE